MRLIIINLINTAGRNLVDVVMVIEAIVDVDSKVLCHGDRFNDLVNESDG